MRVEPWVSAIGRFEADGAWVGFRPTADGYELVFGEADGSRRVAPASRPELLAAAIAYFEEALQDPPAELEATQHDLGTLLRWLHASEPDPPLAGLLLQALDGIDDGLAGDVLVARLSGALTASGIPDEQAADAVDLLVERYRALSA